MKIEFKNKAPKVFRCHESELPDGWYCGAVRGYALQAQTVFHKSYHSLFFATNDTTQALILNPQSGDMVECIPVRVSMVVEG